MNRVRKYLDVSMAHITYGDSQLLEVASEHNGSRSMPNKQAFKLVVYKYEYGFFIPLTSIVLKNPSTLRVFGYSEAFIELIEYARDQECKLICLDRDAEPTDELEKFEW